MYDNPHIYVLTFYCYQNDGVAAAAAVVVVVAAAPGYYP
jgi:hypothetical protein